MFLNKEEFLPPPRAVALTRPSNSVGPGTSRVGCLALGWLRGCAASTVLTSLWYLFARHVAVTWVFGVLDKAIVVSLRYLVR